MKNGPSPSADPVSNVPDLCPETMESTQRIKNALRAGNGGEAIRLYKEAMTNGLVQRTPESQFAFHRAIGNDAMQALVEYFATLACFYCNRGLLTCSECEGRGHEPDGTLCMQCLALGRNRCDFCGGSGWFTIHHVPESLRRAVILRRVHLAGNEAKPILSKPISAVASSTLAADRKHAATELLQVNRLLGVLENMLLAARQEGLQDGLVINEDEWTTACLRLASKLQLRTRQLLLLLAEAALIEQSVGGSALAGDRADFYERLAASREFEGTALRHPFLQGDSATGRAPDPERG